MSSFDVERDKLREALRSHEQRNEKSFHDIMRLFTRVQRWLYAIMGSILTLAISVAWLIVA